WSTYLPKLIVSLNGTNFKVWKEVVATVLDCTDSDLALWVEKPILILDNLQEVKIKKWKCSNRMCLMIIKRLILKAFRGFIFESQRKLGVERVKDVLELIHTDICGHFPPASWNGQQYFITFIDDYSRYGYLCLSFKAEVELQLAVKSDRGGEYYGKYDGSGEQRPGPFALFLRECGIVPQYTMPDKPSMNGVAERRNQTLKDMSFFFTRVTLGRCPYRPHERKLDSRTVSCYFVGYAERSRGYKFYDPTSRSFFLKRKMRGFLRKIFEEESINDIGQVLVPITIQETTPVIGDNVQTIVPDIVPEQDCDEVLPQPPIEQPQQPQQV
ncbi:hypothetical protein CR513_58793, partial [Mucuna pruriens]